MSARSFVLGRFPSQEALYAAVRALRQAGRESIDLHSPYPLPGSDEVLGLKRSKVPLIALVGALTGIATAVAMQVWMNAVDYPLNVGNRGLVPYPALVPVTFELAVLFSALSIFFGMLGGLFGFPRPHHPVFEVDAFRSASVDALWLSVETPSAQAERVAEELRRIGAADVAIAPEDA